MEPPKCEQPGCTRDALLDGSSPFCPRHKYTFQQKQEREARKRAQDEAVAASEARKTAEHKPAAMDVVGAFPQDPPRVGHFPFGRAQPTLLSHASRSLLPRAGPQVRSMCGRFRSILSLSRPT